MAFSPLDVLNEARRAVPFVDYALGAAGVAAACAIAIDLLGSSGRASFLIFGAMLVAMVLLFALSRLLQSSSTAINAAAIVILWAVALFFVAFLIFTTTACGFYWPPGWADILGLSKKDAPLYYEGQPSFNCYLDRNADEQTICHSASLARMDVQLDDRYQQLRQNLPADRFKPVHDAQIAWLASRRNCGSSDSCIKDLYTARLAQLEAALRSG